MMLLNPFCSFELVTIHDDIQPPIEHLSGVFSFHIITSTENTGFLPMTGDCMFRYGDMGLRVSYLTVG